MEAGVLSRGKGSGEGEGQMRGKFSAGSPLICSCCVVAEWDALTIAQQLQMRGKLCRLPLYIKINK